MAAETDKIIIVGAGLCGTLLAIRMAQRGYQVSLYEKRPDLRKNNLDAGRSINLALSDRGIQALNIAGLKSKVIENTIPMKGRFIHPLEGEAFLSPYSGRGSEHINSVSRPGLNILMLDELEKYNNVTIQFNTFVEKVHLDKAEIEYKADGLLQKDKGCVVIGTDGAGSAIRKSMMSHSNTLHFNYSQEFLHHGYKELSITPSALNEWQIEKEALHIWPRGEFMIIALPNLDRSFTLTMFHPYNGPEGFNNLDTKEKVQLFFEKYYPSLLPYIPHYLDAFFESPTSSLATIKCFPWQANGKTLIMGDASHAIVPFYGQGMNASLEDVKIFDELVEQYGTNWEIIFNKFQDLRKINSDAIADLAIDNFHEMRDHVGEVAFIRKRKIEMQLEKQYSDYFSKYSLVTFCPHLSYYEAMKRGRKQDEVLLKMCQSKDFEQFELHDFYHEVKSITV